MEKYYVADAHCDFLYFAAKENFDIRNIQKYQCMTLDRMREGNVALQFFAAWTDDKEKHRSPLQQGLDMMAAYHRMLNQNSGVFTPFTPGFDPKSGKIATVLSIENLSCMEDNLNNLDIFYLLGVRAATLTWNGKSTLASSSAAKHDEGLTKLGKATVEKLTQLKIAVDLAHLSDRGIDDVLEITDKPVFSSHTNARDFFFSPRSMKDAHIREIARRGGVIGVNFFYKQLTHEKHAYVSDVVNHICYISEKFGTDCVALGSDFDGMNLYPENLQHSGHMQNIAHELERRGMSRDEIEKIMYGNLARYMTEFV